MERVKEIWRNADAVMFDVDSTLIQELAIHELAKFCGKEEPILELATEAQNKELPFSEALRQSMALISPTKNQITEFNATRNLNLSSKAKDLVNLLHERGVQVYIASGSFKCLLTPIAQELNIPDSNIFCNQFKFFYNGKFAGFIEDLITVEEHGKAKVAGLLKERYGYRNLVNIGDGYTDVDACPPSDAFIGYGGNVTRDYVKEKALWYVTDFNDLIQELKKKN